MAGENKTEILLESGTGELEVLEFSVKDVKFAINVAKIQEIVINQKITPTPMARPGVRGMMDIRNNIYTVIDLRKILFGYEYEPEDNVYYILTNFNNLHMAFIVEKVYNIRRVEWKDMIKPNAVLNNETNVSITGILNLENDIISILDFEKIVADICPEMGLKVETVSKDSQMIDKRTGHKILVADDSKMLNRMISNTISAAGYEVVSVEDGRQALNYITENRSNLSLVVSDIEMPEMDGLQLAKELKSKYNDLPIIMFSSLVNDALRAKVSALDINDLVTKPEIGELVSKIDSYVLQ